MPQRMPSEVGDERHPAHDLRRPRIGIATLVAPTGGPLIRMRTPPRTEENMTAAIPNTALVAARAQAAVRAAAAVAAGAGASHEAALDAAEDVGRGANNRDSIRGELFLVSPAMGLHVKPNSVLTSLHADRDHPLSIPNWVVCENGRISVYSSYSQQAHLLQEVQFDRLTLMFNFTSTSGVLTQQPSTAVPSQTAPGGGAHSRRVSGTGSVGRGHHGWQSFAPLTSRASDAASRRGTVVSRTNSSPAHLLPSDGSVATPYSGALGEPPAAAAPPPKQYYFGVDCIQYVSATLDSGEDTTLRQHKLLIFSTTHHADYLDWLSYFDELSQTGAARAAHRDQQLHRRTLSPQTSRRPSPKAVRPRRSEVREVDAHGHDVGSRAYDPWGFKYVGDASDENGTKLNQTLQFVEELPSQPEPLADQTELRAALDKASHWKTAYEELHHRSLHELQVSECAIRQMLEETATVALSMKFAVSSLQSLEVTAASHWPPSGSGGKLLHSMPSTPPSSKMPTPKKTPKTPSLLYVSFGGDRPEPLLLSDTTTAPALDALREQVELFAFEHDASTAALRQAFDEQTVQLQRVGTEYSRLQLELQQLRSKVIDLVETQSIDAGTEPEAQGTAVAVTTLSRAQHAPCQSASAPHQRVATLAQLLHHVVTAVLLATSESRRRDDQPERTAPPRRRRMLPRPTTVHTRREGRRQRQPMASETGKVAPLAQATVESADDPDDVPVAMEHPAERLHDDAASSERTPLEPWEVASSDVSGVAVDAQPLDDDPVNEDSAAARSRPPLPWNDAQESHENDDDVADSQDEALGGSSTTTTTLASSSLYDVDDYGAVEEREEGYQALDEGRSVTQHLVHQTNALVGYLRRLECEKVELQQEIRLLSRSANANEAELRCVRDELVAAYAHVQSQWRAALESDRAIGVMVAKEAIDRVQLAGSAFSEWHGIAVLCVEELHLALECRREEALRLSNALHIHMNHAVQQDEVIERLEDALRRFEEEGAELLRAPAMEMIVEVPSPSPTPILEGARTAAASGANDSDGVTAAAPRSTNASEAQCSPPPTPTVTATAGDNATEPQPLQPWALPTTNVPYALGGDVVGTALATIQGELQRSDFVSMSSGHSAATSSVPRTATNAAAAANFETRSPIDTLDSVRTPLVRTPLHASGPVRSVGRTVVKTNSRRKLVATPSAPGVPRPAAAIPRTPFVSLGPARKKFHRLLQAMTMAALSKEARVTELKPAHDVPASGHPLAKDAACDAAESPVETKTGVQATSAVPEQPPAGAVSADASTHPSSPTLAETSARLGSALDEIQEVSKQQAEQARTRTQQMQEVLRTERVSHAAFVKFIGALFKRLQRDEDRWRVRVTELNGTLAASPLPGITPVGETDLSEEVMGEYAAKFGESHPLNVSQVRFGKNLCSTIGVLLEFAEALERTVTMADRELDAHEAQRRRELREMRRSKEAVEADMRKAIRDATERQELIAKNLEEAEMRLREAQRDADDREREASRRAKLEAWEQANAAHEAEIRRREEMRASELESERTRLEQARQRAVAELEEFNRGMLERREKHWQDEAHQTHEAALRQAAVEASERSAAKDAEIQEFVEQHKRELAEREAAFARELEEHRRANAAADLELERSRSSATQLSETIRALEGNLEDARRRADDLENAKLSAMQELHDKHDSLAAHIRQLEAQSQDEAQSLKGKIRHLKQERDAFEAEVRALKDQMAQLEEDLCEKVRKREEEFLELRSKREQQLTEIQTQLAEMASSRDREKSELRAKLAELDAAKREKELTLQRRVSELSELLQNRDEVMRGVDAELSGATQERSSLRRTVSDLNLEVDQLTRRNEEAERRRQEELASLESRHAETVQAMEQTWLVDDERRSADVEAMRLKVRELVADRNAKDRTLGDVQAELQQALESRQELLRQNEHLEKALQRQLRFMEEERSLLQQRDRIGSEEAEVHRRRYMAAAVSRDQAVEGCKQLAEHLNQLRCLAEDLTSSLTAPPMVAVTDDIHDVTEEKRAMEALVQNASVQCDKVTDWIRKAKGRMSQDKKTVARLQQEAADAAKMTAELQAHVQATELALDETRLDYAQQLQAKSRLADRLAEFLSTVAHKHERSVTALCEECSADTRAALQHEQEAELKALLIEVENRELKVVQRASEEQVHRILTDALLALGVSLEADVTETPTLSHTAMLIDVLLRECYRRRQTLSEISGLMALRSDAATEAVYPPPTDVVHLVETRSVDCGSFDIAALGANPAANEFGAVAETSLSEGVAQLSGTVQEVPSSTRRSRRLSLKQGADWAARHHAAAHKDAARRTSGEPPELQEYRAFAESNRGAIGGDEVVVDASPLISPEESVYALREKLALLEHLLQEQMVVERDLREALVIMGAPASLSVAAAGTFDIADHDLGNQAPAASVIEPSAAKAHAESPRTPHSAKQQHSALPSPRAAVDTTLELSSSSAEAATPSSSISLPHASALNASANAGFSADASSRELRSALPSEHVSPKAPVPRQRSISFKDDNEKQSTALSTATNPLSEAPSAAEPQRVDHPEPALPGLGTAPQPTTPSAKDTASPMQILLQQQRRRAASVPGSRRAPASSFDRAAAGVEGSRAAQEPPSGAMALTDISHLVVDNLKSKERQLVLLAQAMRQCLVLLSMESLNSIEAAEHSYFDPRHPPGDRRQVSDQSGDEVPLMRPLSLDEVDELVRVQLPKLVAQCENVARFVAELRRLAEVDSTEDDAAAAAAGRGAALDLQSPMMAVDEQNSTPLSGATSSRARSRRPSVVRMFSRKLDDILDSVESKFDELRHLRSEHEQFVADLRGIVAEDPCAQEVDSGEDGAAVVASTAQHEGVQHSEDAGGPAVEQSNAALLHHVKVGLGSVSVELGDRLRKAATVVVEGSELEFSEGELQQNRAASVSSYGSSPQPAKRGPKKKPGAAAVESAHSESVILHKSGALRSISPSMTAAASSLPVSGGASAEQPDASAPQLATKPSPSGSSTPTQKGADVLVSAVRRQLATKSGEVQQLRTAIKTGIEALGGELPATDDQPPDQGQDGTVAPSGAPLPPTPHGASSLGSVLVSLCKETSDSIQQVRVLVDPTSSEGHRLRLAELVDGIRGKVEELERVKEHSKALAAEVRATMDDTLILSSTSSTPSLTSPVPKKVVARKSKPRAVSMARTVGGVSLSGTVSLKKTIQLELPEAPAERALLHQQEVGDGGVTPTALSPYPQDGAATTGDEDSASVGTASIGSQPLQPLVTSDYAPPIPQPTTALAPRAEDSAVQTPTTSAAPGAELSAKPAVSGPMEELHRELKRRLAEVRDLKHAVKSSLEVLCNALGIALPKRREGLEHHRSALLYQAAVLATSEIKTTRESLKQVESLLPALPTTPLRQAETQLKLSLDADVDLPPLSNSSIMAPMPSSLMERQGAIPPPPTIGDPSAATVFPSSEQPLHEVIQLVVNEFRRLKGECTSLQEDAENTHRQRSFLMQQFDEELDSMRAQAMAATEEWSEKQTHLQRDADELRERVAQSQRLFGSVLEWIDGVCRCLNSDGEGLEAKYRTAVVDNLAATSTAMLRSYVDRFEGERASHREECDGLRATASESRRASEVHAITMDQCTTVICQSLLELCAPSEDLRVADLAANSAEQLRGAVAAMIRYVLNLKESVDIMEAHRLDASLYRRVEDKIISPVLVWWESAAGPGRNAATTNIVESAGDDSVLLSHRPPSPPRAFPSSTVTVSAIAARPPGESWRQREAHSATLGGVTMHRGSTNYSAASQTSSGSEGPSAIDVVAGIIRQLMHNHKVRIEVEDELHRCRQTLERPLLRWRQSQSRELSDIATGTSTFSTCMVSELCATTVAILDSTLHDCHALSNELRAVTDEANAANAKLNDLQSRYANDYRALVSKVRELRQLVGHKLRSDEETESHIQEVELALEHHPAELQHLSQERMEVAQHIQHIKSLLQQRRHWEDETNTLLHDLNWRRDSGASSQY